MNEGSDNKQIRWALLCDSLQLKKWQAEVIKKINELNYCELCLIIVNVNKEKTPGFYNKILHYPYTNFLFRIYKRFFLKLKAEEYIDLSEELKKLPQINCKTFKRGIYSEYFYKEDIEQIKEYKLDFILRFGFNIIKGEILESASYGVWSYHHGNPLNYRGGPPAFWEIFKNDNITGVVLQKLTDKLDSGVILKTAYFKTIKHSFSANLDNILINASYMVKAVCIDLYYEAASYFEDKPLQTNAPIYKYPSNIKTFIFLLKLAVNKIKFHFNDLFIAEQWTAGIIKEKIEKVLYTNKNEINWIENKNRYTYRADVFLCNNKGQTLLVYEKYNYKLQKGNISGLYLNNDLSEGEEITLLEAKTHFAYPYTFQHNDKVYCIPESAGLNKINLYQIDFNTGKMLFIKTLLDNIDAVDSTLFNYKNYWWLFFTRKSQDTNTKLYIYYSDYFDGVYKPHANNPVKTDIRSSRPAGTPFLLNNNLIRPAQNCFKTYGGSIVFNVITILNPYNFNEVYYDSLLPIKSYKYNKGVHTVASQGKLTIIDSKRLIFIPAAFFNKLKSKVKKFFLPS